MHEYFGDIVFRYTRKQAIEDGVLIDVTDQAREAGFTVPLALTADAWCEAVSVNETAEGYGQSESGRLWDVLSMLRFSISAGPEGQSQVKYPVIVRDGPGKERKVDLKAVIGPGDAGEPVITIMLPNED